MFLDQLYSKVNLPILDAICSRAEFTKLSDKNNAIKEMKINLQSHKDPFEQLER